MNKTFRPLKSHLLARLDKSADLIGNIYLPDSAKDKPISGVVQAVGPAVERVRKGDRVYFGEFVGHRFDEEQVIIEEDDVLAVEDK